MPNEFLSIRRNSKGDRQVVRSVALVENMPLGHFPFSIALGTRKGLMEPGLHATAHDVQVHRYHPESQEHTLRVN